MLVEQGNRFHHLRRLVLHFSSVDESKVHTLTAILQWSKHLEGLQFAQAESILNSSESTDLVDAILSLTSLRKLTVEDIGVKISRSFANFGCH